MKYSKNSAISYLIRLDPGDDILRSLRDFSKREGVQSASFQGLGSLQHARVGHFDFRRTHEYEFHDYDEDLEVLSILGNITLLGGEPTVHAQLSLSRRDCTQIGGHADEGCIVNLLEIQLTKMDATFQRKRNPKLGLNIIAIQ